MENPNCDHITNKKEIAKNFNTNYSNLGRKQAEKIREVDHNTEKTEYIQSSVVTLLTGSSRYI